MFIAYQTSVVRLALISYLEYVVLFIHFFLNMIVILETKVFSDRFVTLILAYFFFVQKLFFKGHINQIS